MHFLDFMLYSFLFSYLDNDMAGRHRARNKSIQIIRTAVVPAQDCKRPHTLQYHVCHTPLHYVIYSLVPYHCSIGF